MTPKDIKADTSLIFLIEDNPVVGQLRNWVTARENMHYSGIDVSDHVWIVDNSTGATFTKWEPEVVHKHMSNDFSYVDYKLGEQEATMQIDLRA